MSHYFEIFSIISSINLDVIFHGEFCDMKQTVMQKRRHPQKNKYYAYYANSKVCELTFSLVFLQPDLGFPRNVHRQF